MKKKNNNKNKKRGGVKRKRMRREGIKEGEIIGKIKRDWQKNIKRERVIK